MNFTSPIKLIFPAFIILTVFACSKDDESALKGCCKIEAIDDSFGNGHIYVSNIFTPDNDNVNDNLILIADSVKVINTVEIMRENGDVIVQATGLSSSNWWTIWDGTVDGEVQKGLYSIRITAEADDGTVRTFDGKVCNYPCGSLEMNDIISSDGCQFGDQVNASYSFDPTIMSAENFQACFN